MTTRNLDPVLRPQSVAVIGASDRDGSVGTVVLRNILAGGFGGDIYAVNPKYGSVQGQQCFHSVAGLPHAPDLAVIVTPPATVPGIVEQLAAKGCPGAVVITAGIGVEGGLRQRMLDAASPSLMRILGP